MDYCQDNEISRVALPGPDRTLSEDRVRLMIERAVSDSLDRHEQKMLKHIDTRFVQLHDTFTSAFPGGDPHGHRMAHEKAIRDADGWNKIKGDLISKFMTSGLWIAGAYLVVVVWQAFKDSVNK